MSADAFERLDLGPAGVGFVIQGWDADPGALLVPKAGLNTVTTTALSFSPGERVVDAVDVNNDGAPDLAVLVGGLEGSHLEFWMSN